MDLIADFLTATQHLRSPLIYRKWSAIGMVSTALSRCVWTSVLPGKPLYPNMNIMLVGEPAIGKSEAIGAVKDVFATFGERILLGADTTTMEAAVQNMGAYFQEKEIGTPQSYALINGEIGTLFKEWKPWHFQTLARLWDTNEPKFEYHIKTGINDYLYEPYVCLLVGAQPHWLSVSLPPNAFELGLPSRFMFIYEDKKVAPGQEGEHIKGALQKLVGDLGRVSMARGEVPFTEQAMAAYREWERGGMPPEPQDFLLRHYCTRRGMHLGKLALIVAMSRHPGERVVTEKDLRDAQALLFEAEVRMPEALAFAGSNPFRGAEMGVVDYVRRVGERTGEAVPERVIRDLLTRHIPSDRASKSLDELVAQGWLVIDNSVAESPRRNFRAGRLLT